LGSSFQAPRRLTFFQLLICQDFNQIEWRTMPEKITWQEEDLGDKRKSAHHLFNVKHLSAKLKLIWFDDCFRVGEMLLIVVLILSTLGAVGTVFGGWLFAIVGGTVYLLSRPEGRGVEHAQFRFHLGYRFKVWQGYSGRGYWQPLDWPCDAQRGIEATPYKAQKTAEAAIETYLAAGVIPDLEEPLTEYDQEMLKDWRDFHNWCTQRHLNGNLEARLLQNALKERAAIAFWKEQSCRERSI
jgi:hypothetical protein